MRRTVAGIAMAAMLLGPVCGLAATKHGGTSPSVSWWEDFVRWTVRIVVGQSTKDGAVGTAPPDKADPMSDQGITWDDKG